MTNQQGLTYIEMMIVVVILAIVAAIAVPGSSTNDHRKLDTAAQEVAEAIRFARIEAMRSNIPYGLKLDNNNETIKVFSYPSATVTYNVYHPVTKKKYTLNLTTDTAIKGVDLLNHSLYYLGTSGNKQYLGFSKQGIPKIHENGTNHMLNGNATITLSYAGQTRIVSTSPMTGRVTIQ